MAIEVKLEAKLAVNPVAMELEMEFAAKGLEAMAMEYEMRPLADHFADLRRPVGPFAAECLFECRREGLALIDWLSAHRQRTHSPQRLVDPSSHEVCLPLPALYAQLLPVRG
jgi:hypothetical protein